MYRATRVLARASLVLAYALFAPPVAAQQPDMRADGGAVEPPKLRKFVEATYPAEAERDGLEAQVVLALRVDAAGRVESAEVQTAAGHGFDEAAVEAARGFEFDPATRGGRPIPAKILYRYEFRRPAQPAAPPPAAQPARGLLRGRVTLGASGEALSAARVRLVPKAPAAQAAGTPGEAGVAAGAGAQGGATAGAGAQGGAVAGPREVRTRDDGTWEFADLPPGAYAVHVEAEGFDAFDADEQVAAGEATELVYRLKVRADAAEVTVRGEPPPREVTRRAISQRELSRVPGTGGDALRAIGSMPGVARSPGASALLIVRGSAPEETQIFVDGTPVPNVYHFGGFSSVLPTETLEKIDFYPSNFGAPYGRALGGVIDVKTRGTRQDGKYHGLAQIDLIDARLLAEGPVPFLPNTTFLVAGRRSHIDAWIGPVLEGAGSVNATRAPVYYDYQAFLETRPAPGSRLRLGYFGADDRLRLFIKVPPENEPALGGAVGVGTAFGRLQLLYQQELSPDVSLSAVAAYGYDELTIRTGGFRVGVNERPFSSRAEVSAKVLPWMTVRAGEDILYSNADLDINAPTPPRPGEPDPGAWSTLRRLNRRGSSEIFMPAGFAEVELRPVPRLRVNVGGRVDYSNRTSSWDGSSRTSVRYDLVPGGEGARRTTVKGGAGTYYQNPSLQETDPVFGSKDLKSNRSTHYALGLEQEITRQIDLSVEGYYKDLDRLVGRRATPEGDAYFNEGSGRVYGGEFLLRYKPDERFFGWLAYSLSRSERREFPDQKMTLFQFDQTHVLTALGSYRLGRGWEIGARFRLVSGPLYTPCSGLGGTFDGSQGSYACNSGVAFSRRLPLFHQLDLRVDKTWTFGNGAKLSAYLDLWNAYNRQSVEEMSYNFNFTQTTYSKGLPIVPSFGLRGEI
jgi:TonB family protein